MAEILRRLVAGSAMRRTRLHDELGQTISMGRLLRNGPRALLTGVSRLLFGRRPARPWISYDAQVVLGQFLTKDSAVLEFGSGMSTIWYGRRAGSVFSIEDDADWFAAVETLLQGQPNVTCRFAADRGAYTGLAPDRAYDLIMIDGNWRLDCAEFAMAHLAPGGIIYLDNSDKGVCPDCGDVPQASRLLQDFARRGGLPLREFTDFAPTQLFVQRGLMIGGAG